MFTSPTKIPEMFLSNLWLLLTELRPTSLAASLFTVEIVYWSLILYFLKLLLTLPGFHSMHSNFTFVSPPQTNLKEKSKLN